MSCDIIRSARVPIILEKIDFLTFSLHVVPRKNGVKKIQRKTQVIPSISPSISALIILLMLMFFSDRPFQPLWLSFPPRSLHLLVPKPQTPVVQGYISSFPHRVGKINGKSAQVPKAGSSSWVENFLTLAGVAKTNLSSMKQVLPFHLCEEFYSHVLKLRIAFIGDLV